VPFVRQRGNPTNISSNIVNRSTICNHKIKPTTQMQSSSGFTRRSLRQLLIAAIESMHFDLIVVRRLYHGGVLQSGIVMLNRWRTIDLVIDWLQINLIRYHFHNKKQLNSSNLGVGWQCGADVGVFVRCVASGFKRRRCRLIVGYDCC
jgi:hypothetical protein